MTHGHGGAEQELYEQIQVSRDPSDLTVAQIVRLTLELRGTRGKDNISAYLLNMGVRLKHLKRVLKPTGSVYLHCDPTASHYLKMLMDAIFGHPRFRREIIWNLRTASGFKTQVAGFVRGHDVILYYTKGKAFNFTKQYLPHKREYVCTVQQAR